MPERHQPDHGGTRSAPPDKDELRIDPPGKGRAGTDGAASLPLSGPVPQRGTAWQGEAAPQGLSWSWELDFETLVAALNEPAPWNRPPRRPSVGGMVTCTSAPGSAAPGSAAPGSAAPGSAAAVPSAAAGSAAAGGCRLRGSSAPGSAAPGSAAPGGAAAEGAAAEGAPAAGAAAAAAGAQEPADQDAVLDGLLAAEVREIPLTVAAGRVAECLPAGPGLAGWLAAADPAGLEDGALAGVAASWRRLASWAQAGELAAVAQIASRSAARDPKVTVATAGRRGSPVTPPRRCRWAW